MAENDGAVSEQVLDPSPARAQHVAGEFTPWVFSFTGEDVIEVTSWNTVAGVRVTVQGRVRIAPGQTRPFTAAHTPATDRTATITVHSVPPGELLNVVAFCSAGAPIVGQTFVRVAVRRGAGAAFERLGLLIQGPITANVARAWPGSNVVTPTDSEPAPRTIMGTTPAVNTDWSETVPTGARWELIGAYASLNCGVTGLARSAIFQMFDGTNVIQSANPSKDQTDTILRYYSWAPNLPATVSAGSPVYQQPIAQRVILRAGWVVYTNTVGIGGGDQWSAPNLHVREWFDF